MNMHKAWLVFKDWTEIKRNWQVMLPIILVPYIPGGFTGDHHWRFGTLIVGSSGGDFGALIPLLPADVQAQLAQFTPNQAMVYIMVLYFFAPFILIIPIMASSVMGSDSFAGERERKTIEALLATPISDSELLMRKILVSFIPAMLITFLAFGLYAVIVDAFTYAMFNGMLLLPNLNFLIMIFGVRPTLALCAIGLTVIISAKVKGFREAQQISVVLLLPVLGLVFAQISGVLVLEPLVLALPIGLLAAADIAIFYVRTDIPAGRNPRQTQLTHTQTAFSFPF